MEARTLAEAKPGRPGVGRTHMGPGRARRPRTRRPRKLRGTGRVQGRRSSRSKMAAAGARTHVKGGARGGAPAVRARPRGRGRWRGGAGRVLPGTRQRQRGRCSFRSRVSAVRPALGPSGTDSFRDCAFTVTNVQCGGSSASPRPRQGSSASGAAPPAASRSLCVTMCDH